MPRYFMHLIDSLEVVLDPDGIELPAGAVEEATLRSARDCMAGDIGSGRLDLRYRIEVQNADGQVVHCLAFADAVEIIPPV